MFEYHDRLCIISRWFDDSVTSSVTLYSTKVAVCWMYYKMCVSYLGPDSCRQDTLVQEEGLYPT